MNKITMILMGLSAAIGAQAFACPCGAGYKYYYLVVGSGLDRQKVIEQGARVAKSLGHKFSFAGTSLQNRIKNCGEKTDECMLLLTSDDEPIGKNGWTAAGSKTDKRTFAAVYVFQSFDSTKNEKAAETLRKKIRTSAKDAYLKAMDACACE